MGGWCISGVVLFVWNLRRREPSEEVEYLRDDYEQMKVMFFEDPPSFDEILAGLGQLESEIRQML
jgi:hypothetical protein